MAEIADDRWLPQTESEPPDYRMMSARTLAMITGLGESSMRKFVKRYGMMVGRKYRYISYGRFKQIWKELEEKGGAIDG